MHDGPYRPMVNPKIGILNPLTWPRVASTLWKFQIPRLGLVEWGCVPLGIRRSQAKGRNSRILPWYTAMPGEKGSMKRRLVTTSAGHVQTNTHQVGTSRPGAPRGACSLARSLSWCGDAAPHKSKERSWLDSSSRRPFRGTTTCNDKEEEVKRPLCPNPLALVRDSRIFQLASNPGFLPTHLA